MDGVVYAAFGSHCGRPVHQGWIIGFTTNGQMSTLWNDEAGETGSPGAGIWQSGGGIVSDAPGEMVMATGNGNIPDTATPGATTPSNQSAIR